MEKAVFIAVACAVINLLTAVAVLAMTFASTGDIPITLAIQLPIGALLIPGIWRGNRLAWEGGRFVSAGGLAFLFSPTFPSQDWGVDPMIVRIFGLLNFLLLFLLHSEGARRHFRLICPHCGGKSNKAKDLLYRRAQCSDCETIW